MSSWTLVESDWELVGNKTGATRLGFALLLKFFELEARFPEGVRELPTGVVRFVARQVRVDSAEFAAYRWDGRSIKYHREQIREAFGFRVCSRVDEGCLVDRLATEVCPIGPRDEQLREALM